MSIKNRTMFLMALAPAPWFCEDFVPSWFALFLNGVLALRIFWPLPSVALFIASFGAAYLVFKDYNHRWVPESSIAFLNAMLAAKLGKTKNHFSTEIIIGFLWAGSFSIFNNTLYYLGYLTFVFLLCSKLLKERPEEKFHFRKGQSIGPKAKALAKALPLIAALFIFFPRFKGFFPTAASSGKQGEIGYSKTISNSTSDFLNISNRTAFFAQVNKELPADQLYWRGRTHAYTDGYNWRPLGAAPERGLPLASEDSFSYIVKKELPLEGDLPLLETPIRIESSNFREYRNGGANTFSHYQKRKKSTYAAVSSPSGVLQVQNLRGKRYIQLPGFLPKAFLDLSSRLGENSPSPRELIKRFSKTIKEQGYQYSLRPGEIPTISDFIQKRIGFCTHYASLLGLVLRHNNIPARLVSGFQGGEFNEAGGFYKVRSSDAHAWVEYFEDDQWTRVDPTGFISPDRIQQGGYSFLNNGLEDGSIKGNFAFLRGLEQYASNLNYKLALFFDDFDRDKQAEIAKALKLNLNGLYWLGAALGAISLLFLFFISSRPRKGQSKEDQEFQKAIKKLMRKGINIGHNMSEGEIIERCRDEGLDKSYENFFETYRDLKYGPAGEATLSELKKGRKSLR